MTKTAIFAIGAFLCCGSALALNAPGPQHSMMKGPCADDRAKYCQGVQPGNGRLIDCLALHKEQLASACKTRMEPVFKMREQMKSQNPAGGTPMKTQNPPAGMQKKPGGSQSPG